MFSNKVTLTFGQVNHNPHPLAFYWMKELTNSGVPSSKIDDKFPAVIISTNSISSETYYINKSKIRDGRM